MSVVDQLKEQIASKRITFQKPRLQDELLGNEVTADLQTLVHHLSTLETIDLSSIIRQEGHHGSGRAFDIGNEGIAKTLLPKIATDAAVAKWSIDEIIFDAKIADAGYDRNKWNYDQGKKHTYGTSTLDQHRDHIHFAVKAPSQKTAEALVRALRPQGHSQPALTPVGTPRTGSSLHLIDFRTYPDNHQMPVSFSIAGVGFEAIGASGQLIVNDTAGDRGLQFEDTGVRVVLRRAVDGLLLTAGGFAGPVTLTALDSSGAVVHHQVLTPPDRLIRSVLNAPGVRTLELTGGGGEGVLVELVVPD
jgi:hypothetical protein